MLQSHELFALARDLARAKVLTAYVNRRAANPSDRDGWRPALASALSDTRQTIENPNERRSFDDASTLLTQALSAAPPANGHAAFVTSDTVAHCTALPSNVGTLVAWRDGPAIAPYIRVLDEQPDAIVVALHSGAIRLHRYTAGTLESLGDFDAASASAPANKRRIAEAAAARLAAIGDDDSVILLAGESAWAKRFADALPPTMLNRVLVERAVLSGPRDIVRSAKTGAMKHRRLRSRELAKRVVAAMGGKAVRGANAVFDAIEFRAVDLLLLSGHAVRTRWNEVEDLIAGVIGQGAKVKTLSGEGAALLDRACNGIAARTRFAFDSRMPVRSVANAPSAMPLATA